MATSVVMPALEMAQETGKIISWLKKEGERITKGEALLEVETDKAVVEVEAPADGVLAGVKSTEGAVVPVGQTIAWIVAPGEQPPVESDVSSSMGRAMTEQARPTTTVAPPPPPQRSADTSGDGGVRISPKARRLAKERGVDITRLRGTGQRFRAIDAGPAQPAVIHGVVRAHIALDQRVVEFRKIARAQRVDRRHYHRLLKLSE